MMKNTSVLGIYPDQKTVSEAVGVLHRAGYRATDISILLPDNQGSKDFAHVRSTNALEGAATGAAVGAVLGAALAWLVAIEVVAIPGSAPLLRAGPVMAALAGAGVGGALGWLIGSVLGLSKFKYVAKRYAGRLRRGGILLSVHCDSREWSRRAKKTLKDTGAQSISSASESAADYATTDKPTERAPAGFGDGGEAPRGRP